jgi:hypothetical protein
MHHNSVKLRTKTVILYLLLHVQQNRRTIYEFVLKFYYRRDMNHKLHMIWKYDITVKLKENSSQLNN